VKERKTRGRKKGRGKALFNCTDRIGEKFPENDQNDGHTAKKTSQMGKPGGGKENIQGGRKKSGGRRED